MKKILIMLLLLFLCGMISGDMITESLKGNNVLIGLDAYKVYAYSKPLFEEIFWQVLFERCKCLVFIIILVLTPLKRMIPGILSGIASFMLGFFTMSNMIGLGAVGLLVAIVTFLPQLLFYGGMLFTLYRGRGVRKFRHGEKLAYHTVSMVLAFMLFVSGCVVESLVGVYVTPWMIRLSLI